MKRFLYEKDPDAEYSWTIGSITHDMMNVVKYIKRHIVFIKSGDASSNSAFARSKGNKTTPANPKYLEL